MLTRMLRIWIPLTLLVETWNGIAALENNMVVSYKTKNILIIKTSNYTPGHLFQWNHMYIHAKNLHTNIFWNLGNPDIFHQVKDWTKCHISLLWVDHYSAVKAIYVMDTYNNTDRAQENSPKWKKKLISKFICYIASFIRHS
jgi:hypothetical protein